MGLMIAGLVLLAGGGVCVFLAGADVTGATALVAAVFTVARAVKAVVAKARKKGAAS
jgi:hypothetical protein